MKKQFLVQINYSWCKRCGICYRFCPTGTIKKGKLLEPVVEDHSTCIGCLMCENLCPDFAIVIVERKTIEESVEK
ncbi:4Fe-4S dicluster domain-containing protein [Pseudothermotoga thermarum]|uniref:4Fe-4S ferredoxin iron-sulfur binding domain-containing protein n=1 Tax=Pseudothermotoga thermarum DSM 5069 TaxID=688269 RepID=F7YW13_9THEM|nr:4Fe-4S binding protein [Pseudothermotoga thermarum]AEH50500.1 4Fe-4S ferredoxin iron-sulfur binding domain-containing protein [Pseudothermotoga thermarum DSM 5069]